MFSLPRGCEHCKARQAILFHSLGALGPVPGPCWMLKAHESERGPTTMSISKRLINRGWCRTLWVVTPASLPFSTHGDFWNGGCQPLGQQSNLGAQTISFLCSSVLKKLSVSDGQRGGRGGLCVQCLSYRTHWGGKGGRNCWTSSQ